MLNIQSLNLRKIDAITVDYLNDNLNIICLTETWLSERDIEGVNFSGYKFVTSYSRTRTTGGGVGMWARTHLDLKHIDTQQFCSDVDVEIAGATWQVRKTFTVYIFLCYRSPSGHFDTFYRNLSSLLEIFFTPKKPIILLGDFNEHTMTDADSKEFNNLLSMYCLGPRVSEPTRVSATGVATVLDQIYTNFTNDLPSYVIDNCLSDHKTVFCVSGIDVPKSVPLYAERRLFHTDNIIQLANSLSDEKWDRTFNSNDPNVAFEAFHDVFLRYFELNFPVRKVPYRGGTGREWINSAVKKSSINLKDLHALQLRHPELKPLYREHKNRHNLLIKDTKKRYYHNRMAHANNPNKAAWEVVSQITGKTRQHSDLCLEVDGEDVHDPKRICELFNNFFEEIPQKIISNITAGNGVDIKSIFNNNMFLSGVVEGDVSSIIMSKIKATSSCGPDEVPGSLIKKIAPYIVKPLTHCINVSFSSGVFPSRLKLSVITPVFKKGNNRDLENYRPISVSSVFAKIFEYAMVDKLWSFLNKNNVIDPRQHGFRAGLSTTTAAHSFFERVLCELDRGNIATGLFCDLSRAFDCVEHSLLCDKLFHYGIRGLPLNWFRSYLSGRAQRVKTSHCGSSDRVVRAVFSDLVNLGVGVPQGAVLAPILFLIFINDLPEYMDEFFTVVYADDTSVLVSSNKRDTSNSALETALDSLSRWFSANKLYFNVNKTDILQFHPYQFRRLQQLNVNFGSHILTSSSSVKFLGLIFDDILSFQQHCDKVAKKLHSKCYQIRVLKSVLDMPQLLNFYFAEVQSHCAYGLVVWGSSPRAHGVFLAQKRVIRTIAGVPSTHSCRGLFRKFGILPLPSLFIYVSLIFVFKHRHKHKYASEVHSYNTRGSTKYYISPKNMCIGMRSSDALGLRLFNHLPESISGIKSLTVYKRRLKDFLLSGCFYSIDEYML